MRDLIWGILSAVPLLSQFGGALVLTHLLADGEHSRSLVAVLVPAIFLASIGILFLFFLHAAFSGKVPREKKWLWLALIVLGNIFVLPFYFLHYLRCPRKDEITSPLH